MKPHLPVDTCEHVLICDAVTIAVVGDETMFRVKTTLSETAATPYQ